MTRINEKAITEKHQEEVGIGTPWCIVICGGGCVVTGAGGTFVAAIGYMI